MNHTKLALVTVAAVAAFMIAATTTVIPGHYAHAQVSVGGTIASAIQAADNSQHASFGAGSTGNTAYNAPSNTQTQTQSAGSTGTG
jgi:hypothetical protein